MTAESADGRLSTAARLIDAASLHTAEKQVREVLATDPEHPRAHALMALILYRRGRHGAALREADVSIGLEPTEDAFRFKALALIGLGRRRQAIDAADAAARIAPTSARAALTQAIALEADKHPVQAEAAYRRAAALEAGSAVFLGNLGRFLLRRGDLTSAEDIARQLDPTSDEDAALLLRGGVALARGRASEARDFALWVLKTNAANASALRLLLQAKASQSRMLGLWWRWSMLVGAQRPWVRLVLAPLAVMALVAIPFGLGLLFGAYLIACGRIFNRMLAQELKTVTFRRDY